jgi:hypothetical protein
VHSLQNYPDLQKPGEYVLTLLIEAGILGRNHLLGVDNMYTDFTLFKYLLWEGIFAIGTVAKGRRLLPKEITSMSWPKTIDQRHNGNK